jgi:ketosteroid isomerase-like protein
MSFAFLLAGGTPAFGAVTERNLPMVRGTSHNGEITKILPVLEDKIHDRKLLDKSKEKIYSMGDREVRLVAALCEKISDERESVSSDIAFFLVTALIVLS